MTLETQGVPVIDAWEIGVTVTLVDSIFPQIDRMNQAFGQTQQTVDRVNASVNTLTANTQGATSAARGLLDVWRSIASAAQSAAAVAAGGSGGGGGGSNGGAMPMSIGGSDHAPRLISSGPSGSSLATIPGQDARFQGAQPWGFTQIPGYGTGGTPPGGDWGGGGGAPPNFTMTPPDDFVPPQGGPDASMSRGNKFGSHISPFHLMLFGGAAADGAYDVIRDQYNANAEATQPEVIASNTGMSASDTARMKSAARTLQQKYPTLTLPGVATIIGENFQQTHDLTETLAISDKLAQFAVDMQGLGGKGADAADAMFDVTRSGELAGLLNKRDKNGKVDLTAFNQFLSDTARIEQVTGGNISPSDMLHLYQNEGPAALAMSPEGRQMAMLLTLTLGQQKAGTGINQLFKEFVGGKMSVGTEDVLADTGLIDTRGAVRPKGSQYVTLRPGAVKDEALFERDPVAWFAQDFAPAFSKLGADQQTELLHGIYAGTGTQTGARAAADAIFQNPLLMRYLDYAQKAPDLPTAAKNFSNSPQGVAQGAGNAWTAAEAAFGAAAQPATTAGLTLFRNVLNGAGDWATAHPDRAMVVDASIGAAGLAGAALALKGVGTLLKSTITGMIKPAVRLTVSESIAEMFGSGVAGAAATGAELGAAAGAETGPGFLVTALVGAIVAGVAAATGGNSSTANQQFLGARGGGFRAGPSGHKNDPIYTASTDAGRPGTLPGMHLLPTSPTGHNPEMSPPAPGQAVPAGSPGGAHRPGR